jgi:hypothetical protein
MLLKNIVKLILKENVNRVLEDDSGTVDDDRKVTEKTLADTFEVSDTGLSYLEKVLDRLSKKASRIGVAPLKLKVLSTRQEKKTDNILKMERVINIHSVKLEGESPIIAGYSFVASVEHTAAGNIINISPNSKVTDLPTKFRTDSATCDHCHTKRDRNNTYVLKDEKTGEFKRVGRNCLKNFMPDVDPAGLLGYAEMLGKTLRAVIGAEEMEDDDPSNISGGGRGGRDKYYDADTFLIYICAAYFLEGKRFISNTKAKNSAMSGNIETSTASFATSLMNIAWESNAFKKDWMEALKNIIAKAKELADKVSDWKDEKDWDSDADKNPGMANYFHNMKVISKSPAIQYKNSGYHASLLGGYLREKEWEERKASEKKNAATKTYIGKIGDKVTLDLTLKKDMSFNGNYGTTFMYIFNDATGNEIVYFSSRNLDLETNQTYKVAATVKNHQPSKYNQVPQTIITRGKIVK